VTASATPKSVASTGNLRAWFVPAGSNPLSVAILGGGTVKDVTFSFTGSGYTPTINESSIPDSRLGQRQVLSKRGNFTEEVTVEYVYGDTNDVAQPALAEGTLGFLVVRRAVDNAVDPTIGQKVTVHSVECGKQMQQPPAENSIDTMKQNLFITDVTKNLVALAA